MNPSDANDICTKDLLAMVFLKTKYWGLFRDIEENRDLYTQVRLDDMRASLLVDDKEEQEYRKKHFDDLFERLGYTATHSKLLRSVLNEPFPVSQGTTRENKD